MTGTLGYPQAGASSLSFTSQITGSSFTMEETGVVNSIFVYIVARSWKPPSDFGPAPVRCAIYEHSDNGSSLIASSNERAIERSSPGWEGFPINATLETGKTYVLVVWGGIAIGYDGAEEYIYYDTGDTNQGHTAPYEYSGGFPEMVVFGHNNDKFSIYVTYESLLKVETLDPIVEEET